MPARAGPSLPKSLLEELENTSGDAQKHRPKGGNRQLSRKETRKQDRHQRKQRKAEFFASIHTNGIRPQNKRHAEQEHPDSPQWKKVKVAKPDLTAPSPIPAKTKKSANQLSSASDPAPAKQKSKQAQPKPKTDLEKLAKRSQIAPEPLARSARLSRQEEEDDAYIAYLESKLGYKKGGKRTAKYGKGDDDGLDDLLHELDEMETVVFSQKTDPQGAVEAGSEEIAADSEADEEIEDDGFSNGGEQFADESHRNDEEEWGGINDEGGFLAVVQETASSAAVPVTPLPGSRYVPPHLRNRVQETSASDFEAQMKLTRQLKGLLNRMSEQNIASIVDGFEEVYRSHRRHDVTSTLTTLIIDGISSHSILLDSYVVLHAAFVSALHKLVGVELAAYFVQNVVASYEHHFAEVQEKSQDPLPALSDGVKGQEEDRETLGKECSNLIVLLSELYNFQVISCTLVYDIIRELLSGDLTEIKVELLLKITRNSGQQLRQDDPTALKSIIQMVHSKLPSQANAMSSRSRFMVETLTNMKNNKLKHNSGPIAGGEAVERLKKFLAGLTKKRHVLSHEPLRVTLEDLRSAESKGKWWLVGAAWGGDPLVEHQQSRREAAEKTEADALSDNALLKLARKQGMNSEIRRGIFVVLMSSEDYMDACERLSQLKLTEVQQREIIRVIIHCCGNEKSYNPYYTLLGQQLCRTSHAHKVTLQFCLWDFLRDLGETNVGGTELIKNLGEDAGFSVKNVSSARMRNVARAYGWWIAKDCCTLAILKPVDFTILKPQAQGFLKELITQLFVSTQVSTPLLNADPKDLPTTRNRGPLEEVFMKAARMQTLAVGLVYFIGEAFRGESSEGNGFLKWAGQVARDTLRTGMDVVAGL